MCVVWNAYRKCRILLLNFISTCTSRLCDDDEFPQVSHSYSQKHLNKEVRELSEAIAASIPFLIYQNPDALLVQSPVHGGMTSKQETLLPGSAHGGLLLMHILYVVSRLPIVPESCRKSFSGSLAEIGNLMGIGQATLLANPSLSLPTEFVMDGHIIAWLGSMIHHSTIKTKAEDCNSC